MSTAGQPAGDVVVQSLDFPGHKATLPARETGVAGLVVVWHEPDERWWLVHARSGLMVGQHQDPELVVAAAHRVRHADWMCSAIELREQFGKHGLGVVEHLRDAGLEFCPHDRNSEFVDLNEQFTE